VSTRQVDLFKMKKPLGVPTSGFLEKKKFFATPQNESFRSLAKR